MKKHITWIALLLAVVTVAVGCGSPQYAQGDRGRGKGRGEANWVMLGQTSSNSRSRTDVIYPRERNDNFTQLRFTTSGGEVLLQNATVIYYNGRKESFRLSSNNKNGASRVVNLKNRYDNIKQIEVEYDGNRYSKSKRSDGGSVFVYAR